MQVNNRKKTLALLLALLMGLSLIAGCAKTPADPETPDVTQTPAATNTEEPKESKNDTTPLVVGYSPFSSKFSPFFAETAYDVDVYEMTAVPLLNGDRTGAIIMKGIEGETVEYNGTAYTYTGIADATITENADGTVFYDFVLRDDVTFSDGEPLTVDDVIFSIYVYCDPAYDGSSTLFAQPIEGMEAYRSGMSIKWNLIFNDGPEKSLAGSAEGYYTAEEAAAFWEAFGRAGEAFAQEIVDYCIAAGYGTDRWFLWIDADELLVYPGMETRGLCALTKALEARGEYRMRTFMLDLYPDGPLMDQARRDADFLRDSRFFDADSDDYVLEPEIMRLSGGMRGRVFGLPGITLSKVTLLHFGGGRMLAGAHNIHPQHWDYTGEILGALLHYKFLPRDLQKYRRIAAEGAYANGSAEYRAYLAAFSENPQLCAVWENSAAYRDSASLSAFTFVRNPFGDQGDCAGLQCPVRT